MNDAVNIVKFKIVQSIMFVNIFSILIKIMIVYKKRKKKEQIKSHTIKCPSNFINYENVL